MKETSRIRRLVAVVALVLISAGHLPAAEDPEPSAPPPLGAILEKWSADEGGNDIAVPWLLSFVQTRVRGRVPAVQTREARKITKLVQDHPAAYVPVIGLYMKAHLLAVRQGKSTAATYLRLETVRMLDEMMEALRSDEGWELGSRFMTSLAAHLRDSSGLDMARTLFDEALELDPENPVALYAAAAIREKYGHYSSAADLLRRLLELQDLDSARLRLALCRARMGRTRDAEERLRQLARGDGPDWVRAIAYQEWSQLKLDRGDPDAALSLAREGHAALPHDESLAVLSAFMAGPRDPDSRVITLRLTTTPTGSGPTARGLYNLWPPGIAENEERLEAAVRTNMPLLVRVLESSAGTQPESSRGQR